MIYHGLAACLRECMARRSVLANVKQELLMVLAECKFDACITELAC